MDARADDAQAKTAHSLVRAPLPQLLRSWRTSRSIGDGLLLHNKDDQSRDAN
jgi:hypothetical protein